MCDDTKRTIDLVQKLAGGFRRGTCLLLNTSWLAKHKINIHECQDLADIIADALEGWILDYKKAREAIASFQELANSKKEVSNEPVS